MVTFALTTVPIGSSSRDPIGYLRYANLMLYVRSNPLFYNDPTGLDQTKTIVGSLTPTTSPNNPSAIVYLKPGKPTIGYCGEFSWTSEWFLDINNASVELLVSLTMGGFIGQEVTIVGQTLNCDGTVKENRSIHYWEAWEFFPALIDPKTADKNGYVKIGTDTFSLGNKGDCTTGKWSWTARFGVFSGEHRLTLAGPLAGPDGALPAGSLPSSTINPNWRWTTSWPHNADISWDCCDGTGEGCPCKEK